MVTPRIPWSATEFAPEIAAVGFPDGLNEYLHPEYPDLPYPDETTGVAWYRDPLVSNDEPNPMAESWELEEHEEPWKATYGPLPRMIR